MACGGGGSSGDDDDDDAVDAAVVIDSGGGTIDAGAEGFTRLIGRTWSVPVGADDTYRCIRIAVAEDMYITQFRAEAPLGTHHTVLTVTDPAGSPEMGEYDCRAGNLDYKMLYASGVGTDDLVFPDGVAIKVTAGQLINLNLHLYNVTDDVLTGESGILVKAIPAAEVEQEAEMVFAGTALLAVQPPPAEQPQEFSGGCTVSRPATLFALWPHMHQYAIHQRVELTRAGGGEPTMLLDEEYSFNEQRYYPMGAPIEVAVGDELKVTCVYEHDDPDGPTITFGDSSDQEMCFTGLYRYPASGQDFLFECTEGLGQGGP